MCGPGEAAEGVLWRVAGSSGRIMDDSRMLGHARAGMSPSRPRRHTGGLGRADRAAYPARKGAGGSPEKPRAHLGYGAGGTPGRGGRPDCPETSPRPVKHFNLATRPKRPRAAAYADEARALDVRPDGAGERRGMPPRTRR